MMGDSGNCGEGESLAETAPFLGAPSASKKVNSLTRPVLATFGTTRICCAAILSKRKVLVDNLPLLCLSN
jgi:hypothetical protein